MTARWIILVLMIGVQNMATASFIMTFPNRGNSNTIDKRQPLSDNTGVRVMTKIKSRMAQQTQSNRLEKRMQAVYKKKPIQSTGSCSLDFKDNFDHPMLVKKGQNKLMYPVIQGNSRMVIIPPDTVVTASCPGPNNIISATNADNYIEVTCTSGQLRGNEVNVDWNTLSCSTKLKPTLSCSPATDPTLNKMELCTLKWDIAPQVEVIQYTSVIDPNLKTTLYTRHTLYGQDLDAKDFPSKKSPPFKETKFFPDVEEHYTNWNKNNAQAGLVISRGHLAPNGDFVLRAEKDATYFLVNAVPQWEKINIGVWEAVENVVRKRNTKLEVWTGTYGVLELPQPIFLNPKNTVPVPAYIWKMIYDPGQQSSELIVSVNDITGKGTLKGAKLNVAPFCTDVKNAKCACFPCPNLNVKVNKIFCCRANDLRNTIKYLPTVQGTPGAG